MMYFLFGEIKGLTIFRENSLNKYILLILALATVTETAQLWVPARAFNVLDWVANAAGIVMGAVVCRLVIGRKMGVRG
jgi:VanZ family protein